MNYTESSPWSQILFACLLYGRLIFMLMIPIAFWLRWQSCGFVFLGLFFLTSAVMVISPNSPLILLFAYLVGVVLTIGFFVHTWFIKT